MGKGMGRCWSYEIQLFFFFSFCWGGVKSLPSPEDWGGLEFDPVLHKKMKKKNIQSKIFYTKEIVTRNY